jgi:hypothetical protein
MGKLHFGVTLGWSVVFSILLWFMLRQMVGSDGSEAKNLDLYGCCCVIGYSMLPLVVYNTMAILIPRWVGGCKYPRTHRLRAVTFKTMVEAKVSDGDSPSSRPGAARVRHLGTLGLR